MRGILILFMDDMRAIHCRDEKRLYREYLRVKNG